MSKNTAIKVIKNHYELFIKDPINGVSIDWNDDNIFEWKLTLLGPKDTYYEGGVFNAKIKFPFEYPFSPPTFIFTTPIYHPNIYKDGKMCISILHPAGEDKFGYESADERWRPVHTVNSILLSIISLLSSPNDDSPANLDAAIDWRKDKKLFRKKVNKCVRDSIENY